MKKTRESKKKKDNEKRRKNNNNKEINSEIKKCVIFHMKFIIYKF